MKRRMMSLLYIKTLYLILTIKIVLTTCVLGWVRNLKSVLPFLLILLFLASPTFSWAGREWISEGLSFQITRNAEDDFSPSVASNGDLLLVVWYRSTDSGFDIYGAIITRDEEIFNRQEISICAAPDDQMFPSVGWDGTNFLVVWQDHRSGKRWDIYGARISVEGEVLDRDGIPIGVGRLTNDQISPALSFDGGNYLVAWHGKRSSKISNIYFARVSRDGEVLGKPVSVSPSLKSQASAAVGFDGENYLIVWQDKRGGKYWDIYGARVSPSGVVLEPGGFPISTNSEGVGLDRWRPVLSWDGNSYLVVWTVSPEDDKWFLYGRRVGPGGEIQDAADLSIQGDGSNKAFPAIAWDGTDYFLVWEDEPEANSKIVGTYITPGYRLFIGESIQISQPQQTDVSLPNLSKAGNTVMVVWQGKSLDGYWQIYGQRLVELKPGDFSPLAK